MATLTSNLNPSNCVSTVYRRLKSFLCVCGAVRPAAWPGETRDAQRQTSHLHDDDTTPVTTLHNTTAPPAHRADRAGLREGKLHRTNLWHKPLAKRIPNDSHVPNGGRWSCSVPAYPPHRDAPSPASLWLGWVGRCWTPAVPSGCTASLC